MAVSFVRTWVPSWIFAAFLELIWTDTFLVTKMRRDGNGLTRTKPVKLSADLIASGASRDHLEIVSRVPQRIAKSDSFRSNRFGARDPRPPVTELSFTGLKTRKASDNRWRKIDRNFSPRKPNVDEKIARETENTRRKQTARPAQRPTAPTTKFAFNAWLSRDKWTSSAPFLPRVLLRQIPFCPHTPCNTKLDPSLSPQSPWQMYDSRQLLLPVLLLLLLRNSTSFSLDCYFVALGRE